MCSQARGLSEEKGKRERRRSLSRLPVIFRYWTCLYAEALTIFARQDEGLHHLGINEVAIEGIQFVEPEVESRRVRIAPQVAGVFHEYERSVELAQLQLLGFSNLTQDGGPSFRSPIQTRYELIA